MGFKLMGAATYRRFNVLCDRAVAPRPPPGPWWSRRVVVGEAATPGGGPTS